MSRFLSPTLAAVTPYTPGEQPQDQQYIKLNTNESPYLPSISARGNAMPVGALGFARTMVWFRP